MHEGEEDHIHLDEDAVAYVGERVDLTSVGVDIGSSTSHLVFSKLVLERQGKRLSSRYAVTQREIINRSPIIFTPYTSSGQIDSPALGLFIAESYGGAGLGPEDVDGGAVIMTGEAALRENARAVVDLFSRESGKFVCATAGPNLESLLAAHGSGAAELSLGSEEPLLNVDIGGGTTKFAVCHRGEVSETAAIHLGARLIAWDQEDRIVRLEEAGRRHIRAAGLAVSEIGARVSSEMLDRLADYMGEHIVAIIRGAAGQEGFWITPALRSAGPFRRIVFSGGVAEYIYGHETREFGDLGPRLAAAVRRHAEAAKLELLEPREAIRATCIGASQYTVQLSGDTIFLTDPAPLPLRSVPVVAVDGISEPSAEQIANAVRQAMKRLDLDDDGNQRFALALKWTYGADYKSLRELCTGIVEALPGTKDGRPLLLVMDADVAGIIGALLQQEFQVRGSIVCIDQVQLREFDYIDIGRVLPAQNVVPVVVKSLVFH
jgi:ethanolamine utilization protein EutA